MKNLLFEIGLEELPSRYVEKTANSLKENILNRLKEQNLNFGFVKVFSTPRRIGILIENIQNKQDDINEVKLGPSYDICFKDGVSTKALDGFLKSNSVDNYTIIENEKGRYIQIEKHIKGKSLEELLPNILDESIRNIYFERSMKWGANSFRFIRPIKWILALLDDKIFDFTFENIASSNITRGMRVFGSQSIVIDKIDEYEKKLFDNYVIADSEKRKKALLESISNVVDDNEIAQIDSNLLDEVNNLIEYPCAIKGSFSSDFLSLPEQLITITMKTHQRYFPIKDKNSKLINKFIVIRNAKEYSEEVKLGNEKVIVPRLEDSKFFFDEDLKVNLWDNIEKLKYIIFQKDMGTIYEKIERMTEVAKYLNASEDTLKAIKLCKADLVSNVINEKEFTSLQGFMGSIYAKNSGESDIVCEAIKYHYGPKQKSDEFPKTMEASIVSILDKLDTAIGAFCVNLKPTSSKDPYAIRRATQGICYVAFNNNLDIDYINLSKKAFDVFVNSKPLLNKDAYNEFLVYFKQRIETVLSEKYNKEFISIVLENETNFRKIIEKLDKLTTLPNDDLIILIKRIKNILKDNDYSDINIQLIENEYDKKIYNILTEILDKDFSSTCDILLSKLDIINEFFDNVKILESNNRIAILNNILKKVR